MTVMTGTVVHRVRHSDKGARSPVLAPEQREQQRNARILVLFTVHIETGAPVRPSEIKRTAVSLGIPEDYS